MCTQLACVVSRKKEGKGERKEKKREKERERERGGGGGGEKEGEREGKRRERGTTEIYLVQLVLSTKVKKATMNHTVGGTSSDNARTIMCLYTER